MKRDLSDLNKQIMWAKTHDQKMREIVKNANQFASHYLNEAAVQCYAYPLLKEYAALSASN